MIGWGAVADALLSQVLVVDETVRGRINQRFPSIVGKNSRRAFSPDPAVEALDYK
jgi:hypothetical protein